jgi:hypothetical protein
MKEVQAEDPQLLDTTMQNLVCMATRRQEFVHLWFKKTSALRNGEAEFSQVFLIYPIHGQSFCNATTLFPLSSQQYVKI